MLAPPGLGKGTACLPSLLEVCAVSPLWTTMLRLFPFLSLLILLFGLFATENETSERPILSNQALSLWWLCKSDAQGFLRSLGSLLHFSSFNLLPEVAIDFGSSWKSA